MTETEIQQPKEPLWRRIVLLPLWPLRAAIGSVLGAIHRDVLATKAEVERLRAETESIAKS